MSGFAWVTLATNDSYSLGALVLAHSLRRVGTAHDLAVLITPGVTEVMREKLASVFTCVQEVNVLDSKDEANLALLARPELGITFTKLHCWRLTQYEKCVFVDADTLVLRNCDELFEREELSAAPDVGWPDCFNSGVFVFKPSQQTFASITAFAAAKGSFDGGDQGLLNSYFSDWAHKDISKHLPFIYNMCSTATYSYLPAYKQFGENVRIIHFIGSTKPWLQYFDTQTGIVQPPQNCSHLQPLLQMWWNIFCENVHPQLSPVMASSTLATIWHKFTPVSYTSTFSSYPVYHGTDNRTVTYHDCYQHSPDSLHCESETKVPDFNEFQDPWENYNSGSNNDDHHYQHNHHHHHHHHHQHPHSHPPPEQEHVCDNPSAQNFHQPSAEYHHHDHQYHQCDYQENPDHREIEQNRHHHEGSHAENYEQEQQQHQHQHHAQYHHHHNDEHVESQDHQRDAQYHHHHNDEHVESQDHQHDAQYHHHHNDEHHIQHVDSQDHQHQGEDHRHYCHNKHDEHSHTNNHSVEYEPFQTNVHDSHRNDERRISGNANDNNNDCQEKHWHNEQNNQANYHNIGECNKETDVQRRKSQFLTLPCTDPQKVATQSEQNIAGRLENGDAGLAGALAQMTLGEPKSPGQVALEEHMRRQSWEQGQIDYMGRDSFENIWKKICSTLKITQELAPLQEEEKPEDSEVKASAPVATTELAAVAKEVPAEDQPAGSAVLPAKPDSMQERSVQVLKEISNQPTPKLLATEPSKSVSESVVSEQLSPKISPVQIPEKTSEKLTSDSVKEPSKEKIAELSVPSAPAAEVPLQSEDQGTEATTVLPQSLEKPAPPIEEAKEVVSPPAVAEKSKKLSAAEAAPVLPKPATIAAASSAIDKDPDQALPSQSALVEGTPTKETNVTSELAVPAPVETTAAPPTIPHPLSPIVAPEIPKPDVAISKVPAIPQPPSPVAASEPPKAEVAVPEASVIPQPPTPTAASEPSKPETATPPTSLDSPVPIQVAESVLQADLKESVSEDPKLVTEEAISSMIAPVREIAAAVSETLVEPAVEKFDTPDNKIGNGIDASISPATEEAAKSLEKTIDEAPIARVAAAAPTPETASSPTEVEATKTAVASAIAETQKSTEPEIEPAADEAVESRETSPEEPSTKSESSSQPESPSTEGPVRPVRVKESTKTIPGTPTVTEATPPTSPPIGAVQGLESPTKTVKKVTKKVIKKTGSEGEPAEGGDDEASGKKVVKKVVKKTVRKSKDSTDDGGDQNSSTADKPKKVVKVVKKTTTKTTTDSLDVDKSEPETPPAGSSEAPVPPKRKGKTTTTSKTTTATKSDPAP